MIDLTAKQCARAAEILHSMTVLLEMLTQDFAELQAMDERELAEKAKEGTAP